MNRNCIVTLLVGAVSFISPHLNLAVTIDTVVVDNRGNPNDPETGNIYGRVNYLYEIGKTEVTNSQYVEFLNAKDNTGSNLLSLYNSDMTSDPRGGINFVAGNADGSKYGAKTNMGDKPVNFVSWYDAVRFANWLENGQGNGDTETGSYTLLGGTPIPSNGLDITRNQNTTWVLTSENEWYKAAYFQPASQGGDADNYWDYPTATQIAPTIATADGVGDISNPGFNVANFNRGADWNGQDGNVTTVGSAGPLSSNFYGTLDQGGNVQEWNESLVDSSFRGFRGGNWFSPVFVLRSAFPGHDIPEVEVSGLGFRVAAVPEPSSGVLAIVAFGILAWWTKPRR